MGGIYCRQELEVTGVEYGKSNANPNYLKSENRHKENDYCVSLSTTIYPTKHYFYKYRRNAGEPVPVVIIIVSTKILDDGYVTLIMP